MAKTKFVRHWRLFWTPWASLFIGRHRGRRAAWIELSEGRVFYLDVWRG